MIPWPHPCPVCLPVECAEVQQRLGQLLVVEVAVIRVRLEAASASSQPGSGGLRVPLKLLQVEGDARGSRATLAGGGGLGGLGSSVHLRATG